jgi:UDPglucose 6-dehydrogenase
MHIGVYGSGYLATVMSACLADFGMPVTCFTDDNGAAYRLSEGNTPFYEKNLQELIRRNVRASRLMFSTELQSFAQRSQVIFVARDLWEGIDDIARDLARMSSPNSMLVISTPVPVGTARRIESELRQAGSRIVVVSHPIFLTAGCAVEDFNWPDRIVLGTPSADAVLTLKQIYRPLVMRGVPVIVTNFETAELVRAAATAFVATKVSFINEIAKVCERVNADAVDLGVALGLDKKIGPRCLQAGAAFGGAFVESDMESLVTLANENGVTLKILNAAREVNRSISDLVLEKIAAAIESVPGKEVGILGLAFKPHTNSVAGSASVAVAKRLAFSGARVRAYDPVALPDAKLQLDSMIKYCDTPYAAADGADALVVGTGWPEFRTLDFERIKRSLRHPIIIDTNNLLDSARLRAMGFQYVGVGRS